MSEKPRIVGVTGGAVGLSALALAFGVCCVAPWAVTLLSVGGAVLLARVAFMQPPPWDGKPFATKVSDALAASGRKRQERAHDSACAEVTVTL
jgi:hypothetical protein